MRERESGITSGAKDRAGKGRTYSGKYYDDSKPHMLLSITNVREIEEINKRKTKEKEHKTNIFHPPRLIFPHTRFSFFFFNK